MQPTGDISTPPPNDEQVRQIRLARRRFAAMAGTYCLGVFNDNFFKQAACLLAVYLSRPNMQTWITILFTLPWLLFPAWAGWTADRFPKHRVVILSKALELAAMLCGGIGLIAANWPLILGMMFVMALQSTIFSPALNGSIPELYPAEFVVRANARLKSLVLASTLAGIILAGMLLDLRQSIAGRPLGRWLTGLGVILVALLGLWMSLGTNRRPAAAPCEPFPWTGLFRTFRELREMRRDRLLWLVLLTDAAVWFIAVAQILVVNELGASHFALTEKQTSFLLAAELLGVAAGALLAGRIASGQNWHRVLAPAMFLLGLLLVGLSAIGLLPRDAQLRPLAVDLTLAGIIGGVLLVPCEAFFQIRPPPEHKGQVIATANFAGFLGMSCSGLFYGVLLAVHVPPLLRLGMLGVLTLLAAGGLFIALRKESPA